MEIVNRGGLFDLQNALSNIPGFVWSKYPKEKHWPGYQYLGPSTQLEIRLDENDQPKEGEQPISPTDQLAYEHDIAYRDSEDLSDKHEGDRKMLEALEKVPTTGINDKLANFVARQILKLKLKLGFALNLGFRPNSVELTSAGMGNLFSEPRGEGLNEEMTGEALRQTSLTAPLSTVTEEQARQIASELHKPFRNGQRQMVIVNGIDDTHTGDIAELKPVTGPNHVKYKYILVNLDVFSKRAHVFAMRNKDSKTIIDCYKQYLILLNQES
jgi:hypothetical protein